MDHGLSAMDYLSIKYQVGQDEPIQIQAHGFAG